MALTLDGPLTKPYPLYPTAKCETPSADLSTPNYCFNMLNDSMKSTSNVSYFTAAPNHSFLPYQSATVCHQPTLHQNFQLQKCFHPYEQISAHSQAETASSLSSTKNKLGRLYNPGRPLAMADRQRILHLYEKGHKISHIARIIGVTHSCVSKIMTRYRRTGSMYPRSTSQAKHRNSNICQTLLETEKPSSFHVESRPLSSNNNELPLTPALLVSRPFTVRSYSIDRYFARNAKN